MIGKKGNDYINNSAKKQQVMITPWKFNIAPENLQSQKETSLPTIIFQGLC